MIPIVEQPGSDSIITVPGGEEAYTSAAGPTWPNQIPARHALAVGLNRPTRYTARVSCPVLPQIGESLLADQLEFLLRVLG